MQGYMTVIGPCIGCGKTISFNPNRVPSLVVDGAREPLCKSCFNRWNEIHRVSKGLDPVPLNSDAYEGEPTS